MADARATGFAATPPSRASVKLLLEPPPLLRRGGKTRTPCRTHFLETQRTPSWTVFSLEAVIQIPDGGAVLETKFVLTGLQNETMVELTDDLRDPNAVQEDL